MKKEIEFAYHIKNRWPHHIKNKKTLQSFQNMVFEAIDWEIENLENEDMEWEIFTHENSTLKKFSAKEQALLLKRLKKALVENNHSFKEEDFILEEALNRVITNHFDYISDCKDDFKKEWKQLKVIAGTENEEDVESYFKENLWWDRDFEFWELKLSHIKNYKKILKEYETH